MIQSLPLHMESISWQLAQNAFRPISFTADCAASPSAKRSGRDECWYGRSTKLGNQLQVEKQRRGFGGSDGNSFFLRNRRAQYGRYGRVPTRVLAAGAGGRNLPRGLIFRYVSVF